ncbi:helix-turn-helix domain-containing protein [Terrimonas alba]|uniref:helix-turn-helix domain-containing protein n=1 Tax=Terrimonas alba TaxID=3349636 RepID=UPI0035F2C9E2
MKHVKSLNDLHNEHGFPPPEHPLFSLIKCDGTCANPGIEHTSDFYMIGFKKFKSGTMLYGKTKYDHDRGTMSFIKPGQFVGMRNLELEENGFIIYVHEDFLMGHSLYNEVKKYGYFDYEVNEALHLTPREEQIIWELFHKMETEYYNNPDEYSKGIILGHLDSILKYAQRFYKRQFINRTEMSGTLVTKFNTVLRNYAEKGLLNESGLPTVKDMALQLNISSRYLSDLLKQETGKTALEHIHIFLVNEAKNLLVGSDNTIAETAYRLGFENPPYFSRLFKKEVGLSPNEYREKFLN